MWPRHRPDRQPSPQQWLLDRYDRMAVVYRWDTRQPMFSLKDDLPGDCAASWPTPLGWADLDRWDEASTW